MCRASVVKLFKTTEKPEANFAYLLGRQKQVWEKKGCCARILLRFAFRLCPQTVIKHHEHSQIRKRKNFLYLTPE